MQNGPKVVASREADLKAMQQQGAAMDMLAQKGQLYNRWVNWQGNQTPEQYLSYLQRQEQYTRLLNIQQQRGFYSPFQNYAFRNQEIQQMITWNRAVQQGYATPDQYLTYLSNLRSAMELENQAWRDRALALQTATAAAIAQSTAASSGRSTSSEFMAGNRQVNQELNKLNSLAANPTVNLNDTQFGLDVATDMTQLQTLDAFNANPDATLSDDQLRGAVVMDESMLGSLGRIVARPRAALDDSQVLTGVQQIEAALAKLSTDTKIKISEAFVPAQIPTSPMRGGTNSGVSPPPVVSAQDNGSTLAAAAAVSALTDAERKQGLQATVTAADNIEGVKAVDAAGKAATAAAAGWGLLTKEFTLFGGAFGSAALFGAIAGWHIALDLVIESLAILVPALGTAAFGIGAFAAAAFNSAQAIYAQGNALHITSKALNAVIPPMTQNFQNLSNAVQPQVFSLLGAALFESNKQGALMSTWALRTGSAFQDFSARVDVFLNRGGQGLNNFLNAGAADLQQLGKLFLSFGSIFTTFVHATAQTQVAEKLLGVLTVVVGGLATALHAIPGPALVAAIALHSVAVYGGLLVTWMQAGALALTGLAARFGPTSEGALALAQHLGATNDQLAAMAKGTPFLQKIADGVAAGSASSYQLAAGLGVSDENLGKLVAKTPAIDTVAKSLAMSNSQVAQIALGFAKSGASVDEFAAKAVGGADQLAMFTAGLSGSQKDAVTLAGAIGGSNGAARAVETLASDAEGGASKVGIFAKAMSGLGSFLAGNWVLIAAAAAAAIAYIVYQAQQASPRIANFVNQINDQLSKIGAGASLVAIPAALGNIQQQLDGLKAGAENLSGYWGQSFEKIGKSFLSVQQAVGKGDFWSASYWKNLGSTISSFGSGIAHAFGIGLSTAANDTQALTAEQQKLIAYFGNLTSTIYQSAKGYQSLSTQGFSLSQSMSILTLANVKQGDSLAIMRQKVDDLITGYANMGQRAGIVGADMDAITVTTSDQVTAMSKLNTAWDSFTKIVSSPVTSFLTLDQSMMTFAQDALQAGASMSGLGTNVQTTASQVSKTTPTLTNAAIQLQQQFQTTFTNVNALFDSMRNAQAVDGGAGDFQKFVKDAVAALIPLAGTNKAAAAEISTLAQEAGGPATTNLKTLAQWAGNIKNPMLAMYNATQKATIAASNLSADAANLSSTLQQDLTPMMAQSILQAAKAGPAMQAFATAVLSSHGNVSKLTPSAATLAAALNKVAGNSANAEALFVGMSESMGLSKAQAEKLWKQVNTTPLKPKVDTHEALAGLHQFNQNLEAATSPPVKKENVWKAFWNSVYTGFFNDFAHPISNWLENSLPHAFGNVVKETPKVWSDIYNGFFNDFVAKVNNFFGQTMPHSWGDFENFFTKSVPHLWNTIWADTFAKIINFFTQTVPHAWGDFEAFWTKSVPHLWDTIWSGSFAKIINFFTRTVPGAWDGFVSFWAKSVPHLWDTIWADTFAKIINFFTQTVPKAWDTAVGTLAGGFKALWVDFGKNVGTDIQNFFAKVIPKAWDSAASSLSTGFKNIWKDFVKDVVDPVVNFFEKTIPGAIGKVASGSGAASIGKGILHGLGSVAHFFGLAGGGQVPGQQEAKGKSTDSVPAVLTPGEYVIRKDAAAALEQQFGAGFLDKLNMADQMLSGGSASGTPAKKTLDTTKAHAWGGMVGYAAGGPVADAASLTQAMAHAAQVGTVDFERMWQTVEAGFAVFDKNLGGALSQTVPEALNKDAASFTKMWQGASSGMSVLSKAIDTMLQTTIPADLNKDSGDWQSLWAKAGQQFTKTLGGEIQGFFTQTVPGWMNRSATDWNQLWSKAWSAFQKTVSGSIQSWFTQVIPAWMNNSGTQWQQLWVRAWSNFQKTVDGQIQTWFTQTIPSLMNQSTTQWAAMWTRTWNNFDRTLDQQIGSFFTQTLPGWMNQSGRDWQNLWTTDWNYYNREIIGNFTTFFHSTLPGMFNETGTRWNQLWSTAYGQFQRFIETPMSNYFTHTLPSMVQAGFRTSFNSIITGPIDHIVSWINSISGSVGISKVTPPSTFAAGGSASRMAQAGSVAGAGEHDSVPAILMPGEFVVRKSARMALESTYGADYLNQLNRADTWLGSGSRGIAASQKFAAGGAVGCSSCGMNHPYPGMRGSSQIAVPVGFGDPGGDPGNGQPGWMATHPGWHPSGPIPRIAIADMPPAAQAQIASIVASKRAQRHASGGQIAADAQKYVGHVYVFGGPSNVNGGWDCSSFASWVLGHDENMPIPGGTWASATGSGSAHGPVAAEYQTWSGATTKANQDPNAAQAGDLLTWNTHVGFARGANQMISAYDTASGTIDTPIAGAGPGGEQLIIRQINGAAPGGSGPGSGGLGTSALTSFEKIFGQQGKNVGGGIASSLKSALGSNSATFPQMWKSLIVPILNQDGIVAGRGWTPNIALWALGLLDKGVAAKAAAAAAAAASSGAGGAFNGVIGPVSQTVAKYLMANGADKAGAAGIAATIFGESGSAGPESVGSNGFGLIGWTGNTTGLPAGYSGPTGNIAKDYAAQLPGIIGYARARPGGWPGVFATIQDPVAAGDAWSAYEAPAVPLSDTRPSLAQQLFSQGLAAGGAVGMAGGGTMYDSTDPFSIPTSAQSVAGYLTGFPWSSAGWGRFAGKREVSIVQRSGVYTEGDVLDIEPGAASPSDAMPFYRGRKAKGYDRPTFYMSLGDEGSVKNALGGLREGVDYDMWVAHWTGSPHTEGNAAAVQYSNQGAFDLSNIVDPGWPHRTGGASSGAVGVGGTPAKPKPPPNPPINLKAKKGTQARNKGFSGFTAPGAISAAYPADTVMKNLIAAPWQYGYGWDHTWADKSKTVNHTWTDTGQKISPLHLAQEQHISVGSLHGANAAGVHALRDPGADMTKGSRFTWSTGQISPLHLAKELGISVKALIGANAAGIQSLRDTGADMLAGSKFSYVKVPPVPPSGTNIQTPVTPYHSTISPTWNSLVDNAWAAQNQLDSDYNTFLGDGRDTTKRPADIQAGFDMLADYMGQEVAAWDAMSLRSEPPSQMSSATLPTLRTNITQLWNQLGHDRLIQGLRPLNKTWYDKLRTDISASTGMSTRVAQMQQVWPNLWGPGGGGTQGGAAPGPGSPPKTTTSASLPVPDLAGMLAIPVSPYNLAPAPKAAGGYVGLSDLLNQVSFGGLPTAARSHAMDPISSVRAATDLPRGRSEASAASLGGQGASVTFGDINVYNPRPEMSSTSLTRSTQKAAWLAGRELG